MDKTENEVHKPSEINQDIEQRKSFLKKIFLNWVQDNYDKAFLFVLLAAFLIRIWIFSITNEQALWWDAADYMATAKRWAGVNENLIDMWYYRRGFLWPLLGAGFFMIGIGEIGMRLLVVLFSTGVVLVSYFLISEMFNKKLALLTSIGVTFSWIFMFFTGRLLTEIPATFFLLTALLFFWKGFMKNQGTKYFILFGIFSALAVLTRMQYLMFSVPLLFLVLIRDKHKAFLNKKLWIAILAFVIILIPQLIIHNAHFGNPILDLTNYYLGVEGISKTGEVGVKLEKTSDLFLYINNIPYILDGSYLDSSNKGYQNLFVPFYLYPVYVLFLIGIFIFIFNLILGFDKISKDEELQKKVFIIFWIITIFIILGYMAPQREQRYIMQSITFLFVIVSFGLFYIESLSKKHLNISNEKAFALIIIIMLLAVIPSFMFGKALTLSKKTSYQEIKWAGEWIKENSLPSDIIIGGSLPQLTYYSERSVYPFELAYRREMKKTGEEELNKFILENKPKYYSISIIEREEQWAYEYPQKHQEFMKPVRVFEMNAQPVLVIYEFDYLGLNTINNSVNSTD
ncbi:glycosyltransferase family 39 protein [Candidatus Pacearchaeota archaeon]|nr:glycosyltransferase family 39 protein [Candidatus Pacearchaeota archaeon]